MKKFCLALVAVLLISSFVFAQVCLGKNAARVSVSGSSVTIFNVMQADSIMVELTIHVGRFNNDSNPRTEKRMFGPIEPMRSVSTSLGQFERYVDYEVFACR